MKQTLIFIVLLVSCVAYRYNDKSYYRPRYGRNRLSRTFGVPFGRPLGRPRFRNRFPPWQYRDNYRDRSSNPSYSRLRQHNDQSVFTEQPAHPNSSLSVFERIKNEQTNATPVAEDKYKWIARVVATPVDIKHSPVLCNAAAIQERIFITAARCLINAKVLYTRVIYQDKALQPVAFVMPSKPSKQLFNDIGVIVVNRQFYKTWATAGVGYMPWADDEFVWHTKNSSWYLGTAIGHVGEVVNVNPQSGNQSVYTLYEVDVHVSNYLCNYLYNQETDTHKDAFFVPCYSHCTLVENFGNDPKCFTFLAGEGHIVVGRSSRQIVGVATWAGTWAGKLRNPPLPIGMAYPNSPAYLEQLACAQKIKAAPDTSARFDTFCNSRLLSKG